MDSVDAMQIPGRWMPSDYRRNADLTACERQAQTYLVQAGDAIHLAILTIAHHVGEEGRQRLSRRIARVQEHLVDACHALNRAKLYIAGLWTYAPEVILNQDPDPEREIARLNRITTILSMRNHAHLPQHRRAAPLSAQEEAQLLAVSNEVSPRRRLHRVGTIALFTLAVFALTLVPWIGVLGGAMSFVFGVFGVHQWRRALGGTHLALASGCESH